MTVSRALGMRAEEEPKPGCARPRLLAREALLARDCERSGDPSERRMCAGPSVATRGSGAGEDERCLR